MSLEATVSMSWVRAVLAAAASQGLDRERLLLTAGIPPEDLRRAHWPVDHITRLWRAAVALSGDPAFGLKAGRGISPASLNILGGVLQASSSLREAMQMAQKFQRLVSDAAHFQLLPGASASWLVYHPKPGRLAFSPYQIEAVLAAMATLLRGLSAGRARPKRVHIPHAAVCLPAAYRETFGCAVDFGQAFAGLLVDNAVLDQPLPQADARMAARHRQKADAKLATLTPGTSLAPRLRAWMAAQNAWPPPLRSAAARALGVSPRTLARRLHDEGTHYSALADAVRREWACAAVAAGTQPLADISLALGFAEASTFYRAFRRWTGDTPARWRAARE